MTFEINSKLGVLTQAGKKLNSFGIIFGKNRSMCTVIFYILTPLPILIWKRSGQSSFRDGCIFFTTGFVVSGFALPIVLANAEVVSEILTHCKNTD